jgi:ESCO1/2 acetyl-transferase
VPGWLLAVPGTAFLYICRKTRSILGCLVAEDITEGWKASASNGSNNNKEECKQLKETNDGISSADGNDSGPSSPFSGNVGTNPWSIENNSSSRSKIGIVLVDKEGIEKVRHGIRMMWTSSQARRKNIATKLLDCARCQLVRGYVVPREKLAYSQPTSDGAGFITSYSNSNEFLVYDAKSK